MNRARKSPQNEQSNRPSTKPDPVLIDLVRALAQMQAKADHDRETNEAASAAGR